MFQKPTIILVIYETFNRRFLLSISTNYGFHNSNYSTLRPSLFWDVKYASLTAQPLKTGQLIVQKRWYLKANAVCIILGEGKPCYDSKLAALNILQANILNLMSHLCSTTRVSRTLIEDFRDFTYSTRHVLVAVVTFHSLSGP